MEYLHWVKTVKQVIMQYEFNTNHKENMSMYISRLIRP